MHMHEHACMSMPTRTCRNVRFTATRRPSRLPSNTIVPLLPYPSTCVDTIKRPMRMWSSGNSFILLAPGAPAMVGRLLCTGGTNVTKGTDRRVLSNQLPVVCCQRRQAGYCSWLTVMIMHWMHPCSCVGCKETVARRKVDRSCQRPGGWHCVHADGQKANFRMQSSACCGTNMSLHYLHMHEPYMLLFPPPPPFTL